MSNGLSPSRLDTLRRVMHGYVERGQVPGIAIHVRRGGDDIDETFGGVQRDTIFRISSLTKPITAAAVMVLIEECRIALDDPVATYLPELGATTVLREPGGSLDDTEPLARPITVRDLLTYTYGFGLDIPLMMGGAAIFARERELHLGALGPPDPSVPHTPDEWIALLGTLPLMSQPGERWRYGTSASVLGVLVARVAGQSLEQFFAERIFGPLGMRDTGFSVPAGSLARFTPVWGLDASGTSAIADPADGLWSAPPAFPDGAAGLVSTVDDYAAFGEMLLRHGEHGGARILGRTTVEAMITDQLTADQRANAGPILGPGLGWGLGLSVVRDRIGPAFVPGRFGWDGGFGSTWYADPENDVSAVLMMNHRLDAPVHWNVLADFWTAVYQALDD